MDQVGTGAEAAPEVWVNPNLDSLWHPYKALQKRLYLNASCVADQTGADEAYIERLLALLDAVPELHLMLLAFDYNHDEGGRRRQDLSTFYVSNAYAQAIAARHPRLEWVCSVHPYREDAVEALKSRLRERERKERHQRIREQIQDAETRGDRDAVERLQRELMGSREVGG